MSKELIVSTGRHETRVAILEDDQLVEVFHEREKEYSLAGSIHKGRVTRVLPGMQSAFVDIGLERDAFLYVSDFFEDSEDLDSVSDGQGHRESKSHEGRSHESRSHESRSEGRNRGRGDRDRGDRDRSERDKPDAAPRVEASPEAIAEGVPVVESRSAESRTTEGRPEGGRREDGGRRGRRGRRRGNRGPGGIPESKYFSPGSERPARTETHAEPEEQSSVTEPAHERLVLPGESISKYSSEYLSEPVTRAQEAEAEEPVSGERQIESALPVEHPLAGLSWAPAETESRHSVSRHEEKPHEKEEAPNLIPTAEAPDTQLSAEDEDVILAAAEAVAAIKEEALNDLAIGEEIPEAAAVQEISGELMGNDEDDEAEEESVSAAEGNEGGAPLTASVREPGHRYPHRASRRSRRRGGRNRNKAHTQNAGTAEDESKVIEVPHVPGEGPLGEPVPIVETMAPESNEMQATEAVAGVEEKSTALREENREKRDRSNDRGKDRGRSRDTERERPVLPSISDLLKEGQEIIVQISKEPLGQKGARITSHIALPGRFVVYMPTVDHAGVSRKIPSDEERQRLKRVLQTHREGIPGGYICRTAAEGKSEEELKSDMHFLYNLWLDMRSKAEKKPAPVLLHHDLDLVQRILRDQLTTSFKTIWVDNEEHYESILRFVERFQPALVGRVKLYTRANPIFDEFGITAELEKALRPKVWLKSGGYIVINQTEALVAIDINTGKYVGKSNRLEDTIVKINTDAVKEIVRQIRLRDLGGIIVVDFIDMDERKNRQKVMLALEEAMRVDRAPYKILQFNDFGLVAITRKRVKQSLERTLCAPCSYCEGAGYIKSPQTVVTEILQEAHRLHKTVADEQGNLVLRVNPEVAKLLKSNHNSYLQEVEETLGKSVMVKSDPLLHQTKFDLA